MVEMGQVQITAPWIIVRIYNNILRVYEVIKESSFYVIIPKTASRLACYWKGGKV